jgi:hypothetical protein
MITSIEVENVRLFDGSNWAFPIGPLSAFSGTKVRKSIILKVLLLLRQSIIVPEGHETILIAIDVFPLVGPNSPLSH